MARPPLPLGTWGTITTEKIRDGNYRALTRFRDSDGSTRRVTATGPSKALRSERCETSWARAPRQQVSSSRQRPG